MSPVKYRNIKYCLFDMDGLLLDTESIYTEVTDIILQKFGKRFSWDVKMKMMGKKQREAAEILIHDTQIPMSVDDYLSERNKLHALKFPSCKKMPGAERLIKHLKAHNIPIALATSSSREPFLQKTQNHKELFDLFEVVINGDNPNVKHGKPSPEIFLEAAKGINVDDPEACLVFEDAPSGVQSGLNANMNVVWVPDSHLTIDPELENNEHVEIIKSLEDFKPENWGLPPFESYSN